MRLETWEKKDKKDKLDNLGGLIVTCPVCGREFSCNKTYHVYTALVRRKREYYCRYSCYMQRPNIKKKC